jgi:hypothetical protein
MKMRKTRRRKTVIAYLDGKELCDVVDAALDSNIMLNDMKKLLIAENPGHKVTFNVEVR